ncbi:MAG: hypothetical protein KDL87_15080, partial [Verrucomicrobiae bacterium]|nr:hypothetical protein [Verrucomicrobiae bacterium]
MRRSRHSQSLSLIVVAGAGMLLLSSCATQREAKSNVRTTFGIDNSVWGGQGGGDDSDKIREKFTSGWKVDETGQIRPSDDKKANLYEGQNVSKGREFSKKDARLAKKEVENKLFKTPEYLDRQQYKTKTAKDGNVSAREGAFDDHQASETGRTAHTPDDPGILA